MKKYCEGLYLAFVALALCASNVWALSASDLGSAEHKLNQASTQAMAETQLGTLLFREQVHTLKATYDFAKQGGVQGAIQLLGPDGKAAKLPKGAVVRDCLIDVLTTPVGGSATIALGTGQTATDLKAATAIASYTGLVTCVPVGTAATAIKLTADRTPIATVATSDLTTGKFNVLIHYELSD
ncbi:MAG: hypothetical protein JNL01_14060 [Bdellovibrionales bacterium]|nr:hypothetical protein [Bdellovibrionales bacterium]